MDRDAEKDRQSARQGRLVALVFAGTVILWMALQWLGLQLGWESRYFFLLDLFALAGFLWGLIVTWQIWRKGRAE